MRLFLTLFSSILLLAACQDGAPLAPLYRQPDTPGGRLCTFQCRNAHDHCQSVCALDERGCVAAVQAQAIKDYEAYALERFRAKQPVDLRPRDFEREGQCKAFACRRRCVAIYDACFTGCGGEVVAPVR